MSLVTDCPDVRAPPGVVTVRNTFISFDEGTEPPALPQRAISWDGSCLSPSQSNYSNAELGGTLGLNDNCDGEQPMAIFDSTPTPTHASRISFFTDSVDKSERNDKLYESVSKASCSTQQAPLPIQSAAKLARIAEELKVDLDDLPSLGSVAHFSRTCKPCAFGDNCRNGVNCEFCHLCKSARKTKGGRWILKRRKRAQEFHNDLVNLHAGKEPLRTSGRGQLE